MQYLCTEKGGELPQYPATPIHDIMDGLKRGEKGEHTETQSLLQSPNNSITLSSGAHKKEREKKLLFFFLEAVS